MLTEPMVILHPLGARYDESLVVIRLSDLEKLRATGHPTDG